MQYEHKELDKGVRPWWTMSLGPALKWVGLFINSTKELGKIQSIPQSRINTQNLCSEQKTNITIAFMASFYLQIIVSTPRSKSDTFYPKRHTCLSFCATDPAINDCTVSKYVPKSISKIVPLYHTDTPWSDLLL
jgi:hypothetical protein